MATVIGIDLGGTKTALVRYDSVTWNEEESLRLQTRANRGFPAVYDDLLGAMRSLKKKDTTAVGIGVPGLVRQPEGCIVRLPNIPGADGFPIKQSLSHDLGMEVNVSNDADCFALAEATYGAGKGHRVFVGITMGTGVGGGIVIDGKLFTGAHGYAAEIGHMLLRPGEPPYETDDKRGDVEQFLSGTAFGKRCEAAGKPEDYLEGAVCAFMRPDVFREIAWMCVNITHLLDPTAIAFGGSAGRALKQHLPKIRKELAIWMLPGTPLPELAIAELPNAATLGAALLTQS